MLSAGGDDDMAALLGTLHAAPSNALVLKTHILKALLACLRESHRTRTVFRKVCTYYLETNLHLQFLYTIPYIKYNYARLLMMYVKSLNVCSN